MSCLVIVEHNNSSIKPSSRHAMTAAIAIGGDVHLLVAGSACTAVAEEARRIAGVAKVLLVDAPHYADQSAENLAALLVAKAGAYSHLVAASTSMGKSVMPRVAALLDVAQVSEIVLVCSPDTFVRPMYAGNVLATVQSSDAVKVVTVRATAFAMAGDGGDAVVEEVSPIDDSGQSTLLSRDLTVSARPELSVAKVVVSGDLTVSARPELSVAKVVVSGGRGFASSENFHALLEPLADKLGAALGASRAAVDAGYAPNDFQVGQTGKIVAPQLYIAVGISGAIQHLAGMMASQVIVAINKDPEAAIFQVADYGLVGDLFELLPELTAALS